MLMLMLMLMLMIFVVKFTPHLHLFHLQLKLANHVDVKVVHSCRETVGGHISHRNDSNTATAAITNSIVIAGRHGCCSHKHTHAHRFAACPSPSPQRPAPCSASRTNSTPEPRLHLQG
jgi:hypothetical protein